MTAAAELLAASRLDGRTLSMGCQRCPLLRQCGGYTRAGSAWSCMDLCATCDRATCDKVCLKKAARYAEDLLEIGGFGFHGVPALLQSSSGALPHYIPMVQHGFEGVEDVSLPWAAVPMSRVIRFQRGEYTPVATTAEGLRRRFGLSANTRIVLVGVGKDRPIERYWRWRRVYDTPRFLAALGFASVIVPNYSFFLEDPRPQHFFNRKRSLICAGEFSRAGIPSVPCLQAVAPVDWAYWHAFLQTHAEVSIVAKEFQTGLARRDRGLPAIESLAHLQDQTRRRLHVVAVGGGKYAADLAARFDSWTIIDSIPFMKATHRRMAGMAGRRVRWIPTMDGDLGEMLVHNSLRWSDCLAARARAGVRENPAPEQVARRAACPSGAPVQLELL